MHDLLSLPQIIGYIALVTYVAGYAFKNDNHLKIVFSLSNLFWIAHYYMIGAETAAVTTLIVTLRNMFSLNSHTFSVKRKRLTFIGFSALLITATIMTWNGVPSVLALTATIGFSWAALYLRGVKMRKLCFATDIAWLAHACLVVSYSGFVYAVSALVMNARTILKMKREKSGPG